MLEKTHAPVLANAEAMTLDIPHKGITLRVLQAAAVEASIPGTRPKWSIIYKGVKIGEVWLHTVRSQQ